MRVHKVGEESGVKTSAAWRIEGTAQMLTQQSTQIKKFRKVGFKDLMIIFKATQFVAKMNNAPQHPKILSTIPNAIEIFY